MIPFHSVELSMIPPPVLAGHFEQSFPVLSLSFQSKFKPPPIKYFLILRCHYHLQVFIFLTHLTSFGNYCVCLLQLGFVLLNLQVNFTDNFHSLISNFSIYSLFQNFINHLFESLHFLLSTACSLEITFPCHPSAVLPTSFSCLRSIRNSPIIKTKPPLRNHDFAKQYALARLSSFESNYLVAESQTQAQQLENLSSNR